MNSILLTIFQALQLVALAPCAFVIVFLAIAGRRGSERVLPILYFLSLSCSFILPLLPLFDELAHQRWITALLLTGENLIVPVSFLLILQFLMSRVPPWPYWLIFALPLIGGTPFVYAMMYADKACLDAVNCFSTSSMHSLYSVFSTALIFLLLIFKISTSAASIAIDEMERSHKYWLIIALIGLNLMQAILDLLVVGGRLPADNVLLASTIIRIAFIYLVLSSIFVVFYDMFDLTGKPSPDRRTRSKEADQKAVAELTHMLENEHLYRQMGLTRKEVAQRLQLEPHQVSRIVNGYFHKNFNELINSYRIDEAKARLEGEYTAITVIAFEVGFNSIPTFNRVFKELVGQSPTDYRLRDNQEPGEPSPL